MRKIIISTLFTLFEVHFSWTARAPGEQRGLCHQAVHKGVCVAAIPLSRPPAPAVRACTTLPYELFDMLAKEGRLGFCRRRNL